MIQERIESGRYAHADEVIEEAVTPHEARERIKRLRASLIEADEQTRSGTIFEWTPELRQQVWEEAIATAHRGIPPNPDVCLSSSARHHRASGQ